MSYLLDTNIISELIRKEPNIKVMEWIQTIPNTSLYTSVLSLGEIRKGIENITDTKRKQKFKVWLEHDLPDWFEDRVLSIDQAVADRWGRLQYQAKRPLPAIDSLLVATALHYDYTFVTRNIKDFSGFSLELINPFE